VIATDFSEDIKGFKDVIYIGRDHREFVEHIDRALSENDEAKIAARTQVALSNTWTARVEAFWKILEGTFDEQSSPLKGGMRAFQVAEDQHSAFSGVR
jgi:hypothetical protein